MDISMLLVHFLGKELDALIHDFHTQQFHDAHVEYGCQHDAERQEQIDVGNLRGGHIFYRQ